MVYDNTLTWPDGSSARRTVGQLRIGGPIGFSLHAVPADDGTTIYELYTDDGHGNGEFVCHAPTLHWARTIAQALDHVQ